jgi:hypothetical protein
VGKSEGAPSSAMPTHAVPLRTVAAFALAALTCSPLFSAYNVQISAGLAGPNMDAVDIKNRSLKQTQRDLCMIGNGWQPPTMVIGTVISVEGVTKVSQGFDVL